MWLWMPPCAPWPIISSGRRRWEAQSRALVRGLFEGRALAVFLASSCIILHQHGSWSSRCSSFGVPNGVSCFFPRSRRDFYCFLALKRSWASTFGPFFGGAGVDKNKTRTQQDNYVNRPFFFGPGPRYLPWWLPFASPRGKVWDLAMAMASGISKLKEIWLTLQTALFETVKRKCAAFSHEKSPALNILRKVVWQESTSCLNIGPSCRIYGFKASSLPITLLGRCWSELHSSRGPIWSERSRGISVGKPKPNGFVKTCQDYTGREDVLQLSCPCSDRCKTSAQAGRLPIDLVNALRGGPLTGFSEAGGVVIFVFWLKQLSKKIETSMLTAGNIWHVFWASCNLSWERC